MRRRGTCFFLRSTQQQRIWHRRNRYAEPAAEPRPVAEPEPATEGVEAVVEEAEPEPIAGDETVADAVEEPVEEVMEEAVTEDAEDAKPPDDPAETAEPVDVHPSMLQDAPAEEAAEESAEPVEEPVEVEQPTSGWVATEEESNSEVAETPEDLPEEVDRLLQQLRSR